MDKYLDIPLIDTKRFSLYINTLDVGFGVHYIPSCKELIINLLVLDINIRFDIDEKAEEKYREMMGEDEHKGEIKIEDMSSLDRILQCDLVNDGDEYYASLMYSKQGDFENRYRKTVKFNLDPKYKVIRHYIQHADGGELYFKYEYEEKED